MAPQDGPDIRGRVGLVIVTRRGKHPRDALAGENVVTMALVLGGKMQALLHERVHVACEDIRAVVMPALRHRILLNFEGEPEHVDTDEILKEIITDVKASTE